MLRRKAAIVALLLLYFAAAVWMAFALPALATPNELLNFEYVQVMRQIRGLPNRGLVESEVRYTEWHQPPLYFTFAALYGLGVPVPPSAANPPPPIEVQANPHYLSTPRGNLNPAVHTGPATVPLLYTSRVAAALLGMLGAAALYAAGKRVYSPAAGLLMASLFAFQPTFLHLSGSVNNDMPLAAVAAGVMAFAVLLLAERTSGLLSADHRPQATVGQRGRRPTSVARRPSSIRHSSPVTRHFLLGLLCAAAILTKANGVFVLVFPAVVLLAALLRDLTYRRSALVSAASENATSARSVRAPGYSSLVARHSSLFLAFAAGLVPLWAGWLWLNAVRMRDALGLEGSLPVGRVLTLSPLDFGHVAPWLPAVWRSYWLDWSAGDVGYGPDWLYGFWLVAVVAMLAGWLKRDTKYEIRNTSSEGTRRARFSSLVSRISHLASPMVLLAFLAITYLYFAVKALTVKEAGWMVPEARWWLPGLAMLAWLLTAGYRRWWSPRRRETALLAAAAVPPLIAFGLLLFHLPGLYPAAEQVAGSCAGEQGSKGAGEDALSLPLSQGEREVACPAVPLVSYGPLSLLAVEADPAVVRRLSSVVLVWRADAAPTADYTVNTQLLAAEPGGWRKLAEHNSYPGQGMNPTGDWRAGDVWRDELALVPEGALNGPTLAALQVRVSAAPPVYRSSIVGRPPPDAPAVEVPPLRDGEPVEAPIVASVVVRPAEPLVPPAAEGDAPVFAGSFRLAAASVEAGPNAPLVILWWESTAATAADYTIFVHLLDAAGNLVAQADGPPNGGLSPTTVWQPGDVVRDVHRFPPGTEWPDGGWVLVGAYRPDTSERAPATQAGAPLPDHAYELRVTSDE